MSFFFLQLSIGIIGLFLDRRFGVLEHLNFVFLSVFLMLTSCLKYSWWRSLLFCRLSVHSIFSLFYCAESLISCNSIYQFWEFFFVLLEFYSEICCLYLCPEVFYLCFFFFNSFNVSGFKVMCLFIQFELICVQSRRFRSNFTLCVNILFYKQCLLKGCLFSSASF